MRPDGERWTSINEELDRRPSDASLFLTTEHFTLSAARSATVAEVNSRLQLYIGALTGSIVSLALVAQISRVGPVFFTFALVLLPVDYFLGLATFRRLLQAWTEWFRATQGMNRIRHYYVEHAPEIRPYLVFPTSDDPLITLGGIGIVETGWWSGLVTAPGLITIINSVIAGVLGALIGDVVSEGGTALPIALGVTLPVLSVGLWVWFGDRWIHRQLAAVDVRFPDDSRGAPNGATSESGACPRQSLTRRQGLPLAPTT
jgi:hypothetical protein